MKKRQTIAAIIVVVCLVAWGVSAANRMVRRFLPVSGTFGEVLLDGYWGKQGNFSYTDICIKEYRDNEESKYAALTPEEAGPLFEMLSELAIEQMVPTPEYEEKWDLVLEFGFHSPSQGAYGQEITAITTAAFQEIDGVWYTRFITGLMSSTPIIRYCQVADGEAFVNEINARYFPDSAESAAKKEAVLAILEKHLYWVYADLLFDADGKLNEEYVDAEVYICDFYNYGDDPDVRVLTILQNGTVIENMYSFEIKGDKAAINHATPSIYENTADLHEEWHNKHMKAKEYALRHFTVDEEYIGLCREDSGLTGTFVYTWEK